MSEFIDGLDLGKDARVRDVFDRLYERADDLTTTLGELAADAHGDGFNNGCVPNTPLSVSCMWSRHRSSFGRMPSDDSTTTTRVKVDRGWDPSQGLVERSVANVRNVNYPSRVAAYRGQEVGADYSIEQKQASGLVVVELGDRGFWRTGQEPAETEPTGRSVIKATEEVRLLRGYDRHRLQVVGDRIVVAVAATELLFDGADPNQVLEELGIVQRPTSFY